MSTKQRKLIKAVEKGQKNRVAKLLEGMLSSEVTYAFYYPATSASIKTLFEAALKCPDLEIIDLILEKGMRFWQEDRELASTIQDDDPSYTILLKILEHPKTEVDGEFPLDKSLTLTHHAYDYMKYLNEKRAKARAEKAFKDAQQDIIEKPLEIKAASAEIKRLENKLGLKGTESTQEGTAERPSHKNYRMDI